MRKILLLGVFISLLHACADSTNESIGKLTDSATDPETGLSGKTPTSDLNLTPNAQSLLGGTIYYTGYDGTDPNFGGNDFRIWLTTGRKIEIVDQSIARADEVTIDVPTDTVDLMIQRVNDARAQVGQEALSTRATDRLKRRYSSRKAWRITPLNPGITSVKATRISSRDNQVRPESIWQEAEIRTLVVADYQQVNIETGRARYEEGGSGGACANCHLSAGSTSAASAPAHQLGRVLEINDAEAIKWITEGKALDRTATGTLHKWTFANDAEKQATVAYLRSRQTADLEELARLIFEEELKEVLADGG